MLIGNALILVAKVEKHAKEQIIVLVPMIIMFGIGLTSLQVMIAETTDIQLLETFGIATQAT